MRVTQMPASGGRNTIRKETLPRKAVLSPPAKNGIDLKKIFEGFEKDDYILLGLIAVLVFEGCDDYILLAALGYLFVMGIIE